MEFKELNEEEVFDIDGGIAPLIVLGGAALLGGAIGYACGYFFG